MKFLIHLVNSFMFTFIWKQALFPLNNPLSIFRAIQLEKAELSLLSFSAVTGLQIFSLSSLFLFLALIV